MSFDLNKWRALSSAKQELKPPVKHSGKLPPIVLKSTSSPKRADQVLCIGCGVKVNPGFCYTGSVLDGLQYSTVQGTETLPITGVITCDAPPPTVHVIGGETIEVTKRVAFYKRKKGYICSDCAGNYRTITDAQGRSHPLVKTDMRPGFQGQSANTGELSNRRLKVLNTRRTQ